MGVEGIVGSGVSVASGVCVGAKAAVSVGTGPVAVAG
jgi:hypothetical protein